MNLKRTIRALNDLLAIEYRSLPMYLTDATPWTHPGDEKATQTLEHIVVDQRETCRRVAEMILARGGGSIDVGEFPMEFTDTHFLSLDFLLKELLTYQKVIVGRIERLVAELTDDRPARELAQDALGSERQHLEALEELVRQPVQPA